MQVICDKCGTRYDDADRWTICPHEPLMPTEDLERKKAALALMGKRVRFASGGPETRVRTISWNGYVEVADFAGVFAPHLFVEVTS